MKTIPAALQTHLNTNTLSVTRLWKATRRDGQIFGFAELDADVTLIGVDYNAGDGYSASAVASSSDFAVDNLDVQGILSDGRIEEADLIAGLWDYATVELVRVNYRSISDGSEQIRKGTLGEISLRPSRGAFVAELRGLINALQQTIGEYTSYACRANLGDSRCADGSGLIGGVTLASLTLTAQAVTTVTDRKTFIASGLADGRWPGGRVTFTSGSNSGYVMEVKSWDNGTKTVTLFMGMPFTIVAADQFTIEPGCLKRPADCVLYNNFNRYVGEPHIPGQDAVLKGPH